MGSIGGISPGGSIALGIMVGLMSTSVQSLGLTLQRKSHILEDEKGPHDVRPPHRRRRWQLGMGMFIIANILGSSIQISTLPLPVLSTLQASGLVFNSICATLILGEPFTRWSLWGTCLVCTGAILIAIFGAIPAPTHSLDELLALLGRRPFVIWMIMTALVVIAVSAATELAGFVSNIARDPRFRLVRGLAYGCISGILSAHSLLVAKSAVELVIKTIVDKNNQFVHWQSWALVFALIVLALSQLYYLHRGLKLVSTSVLYPLVFCIYNIIAILDGLIYFHQTSLIKPIQAGLITLGTAVLLCGVLALSWRLSDEQHQPAVGQGSLAPGLGLVEDTEGEDEDLDLLDSDVLTPEEGEPLLSQPGGYDTFASPNGTSPGQPSSGGKKKKPRWAETNEIWGELLDRDSDGETRHMRRRSMTLPVLNNENPSLLGRHSTAPLTLAPGGSQEGFGLAHPSSAGSGSKRFKRRRKSTGFPGFIARRMTGRKGSGQAGGLGMPIVGGTSGSVPSPFQDAVNGIWKLRFWRGKNDGESATDRDPELGVSSEDEDVSNGLLDGAVDVRDSPNEQEDLNAEDIPGSSSSASSSSHIKSKGKRRAFSSGGFDIRDRQRERDSRDSNVDE
ncbi:hypothetical protein MKZ38_000619 [Zalerion maritima]|uniref:Uncharacterized protein n=1 Tax=Zalerion maritima TaxID=339359 RepID=A0AAD5RRB9_9PEZI|nr:hypothetical protein MKZ38_000619 [Zalerion maritima]